MHSQRPTMKSSGVPLMPSGAREIIEKLFEKKALWKRGDLINEVKRIHAENGGVPGNQDPSMAVTKALGYLQEDKKVVDAGYGLWRANPVDETQASADMAANPVLQEVEPLQEEASPAAEKEIGIGAERVYVFFNPNDRKLASYEGRTTWECKVGRTISDVPFRVRAQATGISHEPVIGLTIRTDDCRALEKVLHGSLDLIDARVPDGVGKEWFVTSPERVEKFFTALQDVLSRLNQDAAQNLPHA